MKTFFRGIIAAGLKLTNERESIIYVPWFEKERVFEPRTFKGVGSFEDDFRASCIDLFQRFVASVCINDVPVHC